MSDTKSVHVIVTGRVQGVWYRGWTVETASALGLDGWVRNRFDRSVEAVFSGPAATVDDMVDRCRRGPSAARVDHLAVENWAEHPGSGFHQRPTV
jgi:acylphosphatase